MYNPASPKMHSDDMPAPLPDSSPFSAVCFYIALLLSALKEIHLIFFRFGTKMTLSSRGNERWRQRGRKGVKKRGLCLVNGGLEDNLGFSAWPPLGDKLEIRLVRARTQKEWASQWICTHAFRAKEPHEDDYSNNDALNVKTFQAAAIWRFKLYT